MFHPLSSLVLYRGNSSNQCDHAIFPIQTSSNLRLEEYYDLSNLFVEVGKYDQTSDVDSFHRDNGGRVILIDSNCPHEICNLTQFINYSHLSFQSSKTFYDFEEIQLSLIVM